MHGIWHSLMDRRLILGHAQMYSLHMNAVAAAVVWLAFAIGSSLDILGEQHGQVW